MLSNKITKLWTVSTVSLLALTTFVGADAYNQDFIGEGQGLDCCKTYQDCPELHPRNEGCGNWFGEVDLLYWRASGCGLGYALETEFSSAETPNTEIIRSRVLNPRFRWDVGVRAGLGFAFDCGWDVSVYWTHFNTTAHGSVKRDSFITSSILLAPLYGTEIGLGAASLDAIFSPTDISAKWKYRVNLVDLELGREFCIGGCVSMRPFVGIRGAWTEQKYHIFVSGPVLNEEEEGFIVIPGFRNFQDIALKSEFTGGGVRGGFDTEWHMGCGFSLYGTAAVSVLYGRGKSSIDENNALFTVSATPELDSAVLSDQRDHWQGCRAITDLAIGLRYRRFFCCDSVALTLSAGWENHMFFNDNRFESFGRVTGAPDPDSFIGVTRRDIQKTKGDLCLEGWTFAAKVEF